MTIRRLLPGAAMLVLLTSHRLAAQTTAVPRISGYVQVRETYRTADRLSASVPHARIGADGQLPAGFSYRVLVELLAPDSGGIGSPSLRDAYVRWTKSRWTVTAGQFKAPFSREEFTSISAIETAERATVVNTLAPGRDVGVMGEYGAGTSAAFAVGVFNGEGLNALANTDSTVLVVGRVIARPATPLLTGAYVAAFGNDSIRYGGDLGIESGAFMIRGEYLAQEHTGPARDWGWLAVTGYRVHPKLRLVAKVEDFRRPSDPAAPREDAGTAGFDYEPDPGRIRILGNYVSRRVRPATGRTGLGLVQVQVRF